MELFSIKKHFGMKNLKFVKLQYTLHTNTTFLYCVVLCFKVNSNVKSYQKL